MTLRRRAFTASLLAPCLPATLAVAQTPSAGPPPGPVKIIVPYTPGSGSDTLARVAGVKFGDRVGHPIIVENRPGASGMLGTEAVVRAAPDGSTLLIAANTLVINRSLFPQASFDPLKDLTPIIMAGSSQLLLVASKASGFKSTQDLLAAARNAPGKVNYASPGVGTPHHLAMELLKIKTGTFIYHIPYSGAGQAVTGLLGGQVDVMFLPLTYALAQVNAGKMTALAIGSDQRHPSTPDIPTLAEQGIPDLNVPSWYGIYGPAGLSPALVAAYNGTLRDILDAPDIRNTLLKQGVDADSSTPAQLKALGERDAARWAEVVRVQNIKAA